MRSRTIVLAVSLALVSLGLLAAVPTAGANCDLSAEIGFVQVDCAGNCKVNAGICDGNCDINAGHCGPGGNCRVNVGRC